MHLIEGARGGEHLTGDSIAVWKVYHAAFARRGYSQEQVERSYTYYHADPKLMVEVYQEVMKPASKAGPRAQQALNYEPKKVSELAFIHPEFERIALALFRYQATHNPVYGEWVRLQGFDTERIEVGEPS